MGKSTKTGFVKEGSVGRGASGKGKGSKVKKFKKWLLSKPVKQKKKKWWSF